MNGSIYGFSFGALIKLILFVGVFFGVIIQYNYPYIGEYLVNIFKIILHYIHSEVF